MFRIGPTISWLSRACCLLAALPCVARAQDQRAGQWLCVAGNSAHSGLSTHPAPTLSTPSWSRATDADGNPLTFIAQSTPVVSDRLVMLTASVRPAGGGGVTQFRLFAFRRSDGTIAWSTQLPLPAAALGAQSGPALDPRTSIVYQCAGRFVVALNLHDGQVLWQRQLPGNIVNASPIITDDLGVANRLFISDYYTAFPNPIAPDAAARLYAINIDPRDAEKNPFDPGEIIWTGELGNATGATPAYLPRRDGGVGLVYAASMGGIFASGQGVTSPARVLAFSASFSGGGGISAPPVWATANPDTTVGFFAGVSIASPSPAETASGARTPHLRVSSYAFYNGIDAGNTLVLDALDGTILRATRSNRSASIPLSLPDGRSLLSAGIAGSFGSAPSIVLFPPPSLPGLAWDSALATWNDTDSDGILDAGEYSAFGGWNHQPALSEFAGRTLVVTGTIGSGASSSAPVASLLSRLDLAHTPDAPGFVVDQTPLAGGSVALAGANLYSAGSIGLVAFGPPPLRFDVDASTSITTSDLVAWSHGIGDRDINADASVTPDDRSALLTLLRHTERHQLLGGVR
jgi:outer membrane protein assembly factor BamB